MKEQTEESKKWEEGETNLKFKGHVGRAKNMLAEKNNHIKISDTLLGRGSQKAQSCSPRKTDPVSSINHTKLRGNQFIECQSLSGRF